VVYLIFDNIELLHEWNNGFNLISALFKLSDLTRMPNLGLIFISNVTPDSFYSHTGALEPLTVYFSDYTDDELHQFLIKGKPITEVYASFLNGSFVALNYTTALGEVIGVMGHIQELDGLP